MTGLQLRQARKEKNWTQAISAKKLRMTQGYLSMLEKGERGLTDDLTARAVRIFGLRPVNMPIKTDLTKSKFPGDAAIASELSAVGYPGFSHIAPSGLRNPAEVFISALSARILDPRIVEALPWLAAEISDSDWEIVVNAAKIMNLQNRLGFVTNLARIVSEKTNEKKKYASLLRREKLLRDSRLLKEDTLCTEAMGETERNWVRQNRTPEATFWNILSDLKAEHLSYAY
jgi:transcriptional regulator with XRE-family HTH domain